MRSACLLVLAISIAEALVHPHINTGVVRPEGRLPLKPVSSAHYAPRSTYRRSLIPVARTESGTGARTLTQQHVNSLALSCAISISSWGGQGVDEVQLQKRIQDVFPVLKDLVEASVRAPVLIDSTEAVLPLARLAAWVPREEWIRPLEKWEGSDSESTDTALRSLIAHLLEQYEVAPSLRYAAMHTDGTPCSEAAHRVAHTFVSVQSASGGGRASVLNVLRETVSPAITKKVAKLFVQSDVIRSPLHGLRRAQVEAVGGELSPSDLELVVEGVCTAGVGGRLGSAKEEEFTQSAIQWICQNAATLREPSTVAHTLNYFLEMHRADDAFDVFGRTPKTVSAAIEAYEASSIEFDDDEAFQPNPRGIRPLFEMEAVIPPRTTLRVPYDRQVYTLGGRGEPGGTKATVRVAEILSLRRLLYEGKQLGNCLENKLSSQVKYISRARQRVSSFWSLTKQEPGDDAPKHLCLIEVWHLRDGNCIRQAEGPRPRTIPSAEAWYWLSVWCEREGVDLSTWDCYS
mmetsp:Transcript_34530/g.72663  ORF Transcript_34530/g.72663 Transcript_34530/m.72663 type:complete len:517 (-) Transcript_34530:486-2036(-)